MSGLQMQLLSCYVIAVVITVTEGYLAFCAPRLWEGQMWMLQITHTPQCSHILESSTDFSIDVIGQRFATTETKIQDGHQATVFTLYYFAAHQVFRVEDGHCTVTKIDGAVTQNCLDMPDNSVQEYLKEFLPTYVNGTFCRGVRGERDNTSYFYSVTPSDLFNVPLMQETHGASDGMPMYRVYTFTNATLGVKNPDIFTPPSNCTFLSQAESARSMDSVRSFLGSVGLQHDI